MMLKLQKILAIGLISSGLMGCFDFDQLKEEAKKTTDMTALKDAWSQVEKEALGALDAGQREKINEFKNVLEDSFGLSIDDLQQKGSELWLKLSNGKEFSLNLKSALGPQIEMIKNALGK